MDNIGQLIITGIKGLTLTEEEKTFIQDQKIGGVILFSHNYQDPAQLAELINNIQRLRDEYPLFIGVDQEGGRVTRFKTQFTQFPSMLEIASLDSPKLMFEVHKIMAKELSACGVNLSFSPCCDILTNPDNKAIGDRAYGRTADDVERHVSAAIRGLQTSGLLSCAKHFPGHGDTLKDSHTDLPLVKTSLETLRQREVIPFSKASKSRVEFMMMGHLLVDALDEKLPTSLSPKAYDFLKNETKFTKIVITDDLDMKAISDRFTPEEASVMAIAAGADIVLFRNFESAQKAHGALLEASKKKLIKRDLLIEKLLRVEKTKKEHFETYNTIYIPKISEAFNTQETKKVLEQLAPKKA